MKKIIISGLLLLSLCTAASFANDSIDSLCKKLIDWSKKTAVEKLASQVCDTALKLSKENNTLQKQITILRSASRKIAKEDTKWSDTKISLADVKKIVSDSILVWDSNARYLIIEYSDLQCPFCQRHRNNKTLQTVVNDYPGKVAKTFRHFPLSFHQFAVAWALWAECAAAQGKDNFYKFINGVYAVWLTKESVLETIATDLKLDIEKRKKCQWDETIKSRVASQFKEGQDLFSITGTPGNVILDTVSGQYKVIAWAYPVKSFEDELNKVIK